MTDHVPIRLIQVDRYWFLTWTTYGSWLPGDARGYVGWAADDTGQIVLHNRPQTPSAPSNPALRKAAIAQLKSPPIVLHLPQAEALFQQFVETTTHRGWLLLAVGIMDTHIHALVGVPGDPDPEKILGDLKAYGSRRLSKGWGQPSSETWWTLSGSKRKLDDQRSIPAVVQYIRQQPNPLLIWTRDEGRIV